MIVFELIKSWRVFLEVYLANPKYKKWFDVFFILKYFIIFNILAQLSFLTNYNFPMWQPTFYPNE